MKKPLFFICSLLFCLAATAQDKPQRDTRINYSVGYQFLKFDSYEAGNSYQLHYMMPQYTGFDKEYKFSPTLLHHFDFSTAITKNRKWLLDFNFNFGKNSISSYRYIADKDGNPTEICSYTGIELYTWGIGAKRKIPLGKWGELFPGISLNGYDRTIYSKAYYRTRDKTSGGITAYKIYEDETIKFFGSLQWLAKFLNNPRFTLDYELPLYKRINLRFSYSYWLMGGMINNLYGMSHRLVIKFHRYSEYYDPNYKYRNNLYSHNLSLGITVRLRK